MAQNPRIDQYIEKAQDFARPILSHLRSTVWTACPGVEETVKWGMPYFMYSSENLCHMAAFKYHCSFGLWLAPLMDDPRQLLKVDAQNREGMGNFGKIHRIEDLPPQEILMEYVFQAMNLIENGVKLERPKPGSKPPLVVPDDLAEAMSASPKALIAFESFSPSYKREYVEWINEAKTEQTRNRRISQAVEWMNEGKVRSWKYLK